MENSQRKNVSVVLFACFCVGFNVTICVQAQNSYTPGSGIQFGQVHKPYTDSPSSSPSYSPPAQTYSPPAQTYSQPAQTYSQPAQTYTQPAQTYTQPAQTYTQQAQTYTQPAQTYTPPAQTYTPPAQTYTPPAQTYTPPTSAQQGSTPYAQTNGEQPQQTPQHHGGGIFHGLGNAIRNSGLLNNPQSQYGNVAYPNNGGYQNNGAYQNNSSGLPMGALSRNFSGKPTMVNGVPYTGGPLPPSPSNAPVAQLRSLSDDFPLAMGKDDLDTFDNREMSKRANGGWVQRHFMVGTEGGGIIGKHGPAWH